MPDLAPLAWGLLAAFAAAGFVSWLIAGPLCQARGGKPRAWPHGLGWVFGMGVGAWTGCYVLGLWPRWPPTEDRDRYLLVLLPLALAVEAAAVFVPARWEWASWLPRAALAAVAAPILLYNTVYLADLAGPGSAEWSRAEAAATLGAVTAMFLGVWVLLSRLEKRTSERALSPVLVLTLLATSFTVMLSGYFKGGLLGLPMSGALAGATLASLAAAWRDHPPWRSAGDTATCRDRPPWRSSQFLGISLVGLYTLLVVGRYFGALPTSSAILLWLAPLLAWIPEAPGLRKQRHGVRALLRIAAVSLLLIAVLVLAQTRFNKAWRSGSQSHPAPSPRSNAS